LFVEMHSVFLLLIIISSWDAHMFVCIMYNFLLTNWFYNK
jgi:hypothetical protein